MVQIICLKEKNNMKFAAILTIFTQIAHIKMLNYRYL
jgi:hypothetical protein